MIHIMNLRSKKQNYTCLHQNIGRHQKPAIKRCGKHSNLKQPIDIVKRDCGTPDKRTFELSKTRENETKKALEWNRPEWEPTEQNCKGGFEVDNPYDVLQRLRDCGNPAELTEWRRAYQPATAKIRRTQNRSPPQKESLRDSSKERVMLSENTSSLTVVTMWRLTGDNTPSSPSRHRRRENLIIGSW